MDRCRKRRAPSRLWPCPRKSDVAGLPARSASSSRRPPRDRRATSWWWRAARDAISSVSSSTGSHAAARRDWRATSTYSLSASDHSPSDVELEPESVTQPDILVVTEGRCAAFARRTADPRALLAVEVLSPSSSRHDRVRKRPLYQRHVPDYWIVDLDARLVEHWTPTHDRPEVITETLSWHPPGATTAFTLDLPAFFDSVFSTD